MLLEGVVNPDYEPRVSLRVRGPITLTEAQIEATIDTGFNEYLTLPYEIIIPLALPAGESKKVMLSDNSVVKTSMFEAEVFWDGQWRAIEVQGGGDPLAGMLLIEGCRLTVEAWVGGAVRIEAAENDLRFSGDAPEGEGQ